MFEEPSLGKMLSDVERTIDEVRALNLTQGVRISFTSLSSGEKVVTEIGYSPAARILFSLERELLKVKSSWEKLIPPFLLR